MKDNGALVQEGDVVHVRFRAGFTGEPTCRGAIVTRTPTEDLEDSKICLTVFMYHAQKHFDDLPYDGRPADEATYPSWHWKEPCRR